MDPELLAAWDESAEEELREECEILPENEPVLRVFTRRPCERRVGAFGIVFLPPDPDQILVICRMLRIPPREWEWVLDGVSIMASVTTPQLNQEAAEARE